VGETRQSQQQILWWTTWTQCENLVIQNEKSWPKILGLDEKNHKFEDEKLKKLS